MIDNNILYYFIKRLFLFLDEWLFYYMLYFLFKNKYYKLFPIILIYGVCCIYTSYENVTMLEHHIIPIVQPIFSPPGLSYILPHIQKMPDILQQILTYIYETMSNIYVYFISAH